MSNVDYQELAIKLDMMTPMELGQMLGAVLTVIYLNLRQQALKEGISHDVDAAIHELVDDCLNSIKEITAATSSS